MTAQVRVIGVAVLVVPASGVPCATVPGAVLTLTDRTQDRPGAVHLARPDQQVADQQAGKGTPEGTGTREAQAIQPIRANLEPQVAVLARAAAKVWAACLRALAKALVGLQQAL